MSIDSINNSGNLPGINSLDRAHPAGDGLSSTSAVTENFDWFSVTDGKALPISAQAQFGDTSSMDEMVSALLGHLGLGRPGM